MSHIFLNSEQLIQHFRRSLTCSKEQETAGWLGNKAKWRGGTENPAIPRHGSVPSDELPRGIFGSDGSVVDLRCPTW